MDPQKLIEISVTLLTKNSEKHIKRCLGSLTHFAEVIVIDNGSTDHTLEIAQEFSNTKIFKNDFIGFGPLKNLAAQKASFDWIFSIDSDEIASPQLVNELKVLKLDVNKVYSILRYNFYRNRLIKGCGWYPDWITRIYHRKTTSFVDNRVHEYIIVPPIMITERLSGYIEHYSFSGIYDLLDKMQRYSNIYAEENKGLKSSSPIKAIIRGFLAFIKNYIFQKGFLYGYDGFIISFSNACGTFYKYCKLYELNKA